MRKSSGKAFSGGRIKDLSIETSAGDFSLRAAALIMQNQKLLAVKHRDYDCFYTIGGRIQAYETSAETAMREAKEETGRSFLIDRLAFVQEGFFRAGQSRHHQITFFYLMRQSDNRFLVEGVTDQPEETLHWFPLQNLPANKLVPAFLRKALLNIPQHVQHVLSREP